MVASVMLYKTERKTLYKTAENFIKRLYTVKRGMAIFVLRPTTPIFAQGHCLEVRQQYSNQKNE